MNGPSPEWLQSAQSQLGPGAPAQPQPNQPSNDFIAQAAAALQNGAPVPSQNAPVMLDHPSNRWLSQAAPLLDPSSTQSAPVDYAPADVGELPPSPDVGEMPTTDPLAAARGIQSVGFGPPPPPSPDIEPMPPDVQFAPVSGSVPAHEASIRGPQQNAHLMAAFGPPEEAANRVDLRSELQAEREQQVYEDQARDAQARQEAAQKVQLQRQGEMERLALDYQDQVQQLGQAKLGSNRWWANKSTGDKITTAILAFLGGIGATDPRGTGQNLAFNAIMREADNDLEAQKFDYQVQRDKALGAQNAFAMAMQRYGNEDAAAGVARAASIDYALARLGQVQAQWKGTDAANQADQLRAQLLSEKEKTIAAGLRFVPSQQVGGYRMMVRGQMIPGLVSEKQAQQIALEHGVKPAEATDLELTKGGIQSTIKAQELAGKNAEKSDEGARDIAHQMQQAGIPRMRQLSQAALQALAVSEGGKGESAARFIIRNGLPWIGEGAENAIMSDKANAREQAFQAFSNLNMNQLSGGAISPSEEKRLKTQLGNASDPASRRRAIDSVLRALDAAEANIKAGATPEAAALYDQRAARAMPSARLPPSLKFKGK